MGVGEGGEPSVSGEKAAGEPGRGRKHEPCGDTAAHGGAGRSEAKGQTRGHLRGPCGRGCGDARPGPLPPGSTSASPTLPTRVSPKWENHEGPFTQAVAQPPTPPLPPLPPAEATHATLRLWPGPPESPTAGEVPRDNEPLSRDSGGRWAAVARSQKGSEDLGSMRVPLGGGAKPPRGASPAGGARHPEERLRGWRRSARAEADWRRGNVRRNPR